MLLYVSHQTDVAAVEIIDYGKDKGHGSFEGGPGQLGAMRKFYQAQCVCIIRELAVSRRSRQWIPQTRSTLIVSTSLAMSLFENSAGNHAVGCVS